MAGESLRHIVEKIVRLGKGKVRFVFLFGSRAEGVSRNCSDYDIAVYYDAQEDERYLFLKKVLSIVDLSFDVHTFQDMPLVLKSKVLRDGKILYCDDYEFLFRIANNVRREYEDFKHRLRLIIGE